ncbi:MAG: sugar ABC transporter permease [Candidatus Bipolaricaulota bacterium]|nr:sugar ABC transporter permease [Candidatus Bipolaricaulota bacterium]
MTKQGKLIPYLLLLPALLILLFLFIYPIFWNIYLSLHNVSLVTILKEWSFTGLANYVRLFKDPYFIKSLLISLYFVVGSSIGQFGLGLGLALLLHRKMRGVGTFRVIITVPWILSELIVAYTWVWAYDKYGLFNNILRAIGLSGVNWLGDPHIAIWSIVIANIWFGTPFTMLMLGSALNTINPELYEAATVDGATPLRCFRHITFPLLKPFIAINLILITMWTVNLFALQWAMTKGGPLYSTTTTSLYMYRQAFQFGELSIGSSIGVLLFIFNIIAAFVYLRTLRAEV